MSDFKYNEEPQVGRKERSSIVMHGYTCKKENHIFKTGYLHDENDDTSYDVDGIIYCGRCHIFLDRQGNNRRQRV